MSTGPFSLLQAMVPHFPLSVAVTGGSCGKVTERPEARNWLKISYLDPPLLVPPVSPTLVGSYFSQLPSQPRSRALLEQSCGGITLLSPERHYFMTLTREQTTRIPHR